ncbi:unnamed protein product [Rotaria sordida]|uniref:Uncharacterized protein n=1 Tax=Rotaria sordida TaxID=392033 RepID=A0A815MCW8_9BILA|nr:unnamed protein product [Rotaria sordida]
MLDVLLNIPRSSTDIEDVITIATENENNLVTQESIDHFRKTYTSDEAITWYTKDKFLYRVFGEACRKLNSDAIIRFHPIVKDINRQLQRLQAEQMKNGTLQLPLTVYRGQVEWDSKDELNRLLASEGGLISINTFLSTTFHYPVACSYVTGANPDTSVLFEITVNDEKNNKRLQAFADISHTYKKEGRMKTLIDKEPALHALTEQTNNDVVHQSETSICLVFDLLNSFLYSDVKDMQEQENFDNKDAESLLCFGGLLLLTGDCDKSIQYFQMLSRNDSINDKLKAIIHSVLGACYVLAKEKRMASNYFNAALRHLHTTKKESMPAWFATGIASLNTTLYEPDQPVNPTYDELALSINESQSNNDIGEKLRLLHIGHICFEQEKFVEALNHWEEAMEIVSCIPSSFLIIFNGAIYVQMAVTYFRLSNMPDALNAMEKAIKCMESYYASTHRMFAGLYLLYGYYLMQNDKPVEAIEYLTKSVKNPHFAKDENFAHIVCTLLATVHIQSGNLELAEQVCNEVPENPPPTSITVLVPSLKELITFLKVFPEEIRQGTISYIFRNGLQIGQQLLATITPNSNIFPGVIDEQTCTYDKFINYADYYRHQKDFTKAETYYMKALEKITEMEVKSIWDVYKKMIRMKTDDHERYQSYFIEQYSKYDHTNPEHFQMIATLQIIIDELRIDVAKIIHHPEIDRILDQMKSRYSNDKSSELIFLFLEMLITLLHQSIISPEKSTLSFSNQILELLKKYNDETVPLFYLMKTFENILIGNTQNFFFNLEKLRLDTFTFKWYNELKAKISLVFESLKEEQLHTCLESITKNLSTGSMLLL